MASVHTVSFGITPQAWLYLLKIADDQVFDRKDIGN